MKNKIRNVVFKWDNMFPLDRWWRSKYNIPYLSLSHKEATFYGQYFEFFEDLMYQEYQDSKDKKKDEGSEEKSYKPMSNGWWKGVEATKSEIDDWFKN